MNVTFGRWCQNHAETHKARWCRELYPWRVFETLDYRDNLLGTKQIVFFDGADYEAVLRERTRQPNGRIRYTVDLSTQPRSRTWSWTIRVWKTTFVLIATPQDDFITLYTKNQDPSLKLVADFMAG